MRIAFDNNKYIKIQSEHILERIKQFDNKLYLEFGGKMFDDYHASRVLPGFMPDSKIQMLKEIKNKIEFVIVANANDIQKNKVRNDIGITYESEVLRLINTFKSFGLKTGSIVISFYENQANANSFITKLQNMGYRVYKHYRIAGYPVDVDNILSDNGFGKNDFIETTKPLVVVTAPGPGSGKMATCLSQLYNEYKHGVKAGYAKYETFPIWNIPLKHPVNLAYEAATADLNDVNMIDPFHLEAYNELTVNYNRDIEVFPVLKTIFERIYGTSPYKSPTDMGVNMAGNCIIDDEAAIEASKNEILRRYFDAIVKVKLGKFPASAVDKIKVIMNQLGLNEDMRKCVTAAFEKQEKTGKRAFAIELQDGTIVSGKETKLLSAPAACLINALKVLAGIAHKMPLLPPAILNPIIDLKAQALNLSEERLHIDDVLLVLAVASTTNPLAAAALEQIPNLKGSQCHSTYILEYADENPLKKMRLDFTCSPIME
ncbi:MAG: DUF1846 domain-containing protein [Bacilli bacterium]|nr:DUF1846 domain-containing protein [Bacilli bacterium]